MRYATAGLYMYAEVEAHLKGLALLGVAAGHALKIEGIVVGAGEVAAPEGYVEAGQTVADAGTEEEVEGLLHAVGLRPIDGSSAGEGEA